MKVAAHLLVFLAALLAGAAAGTPALLERAGARAEDAVERALDADLAWASAAWTLDGHVTLRDVTLRPREARDGEPPVARAARVEVDVQPLWSRRKLRVLAVRVADAEADLRRRADGTVNVRPLLERGLALLRAPRTGAGGGAAGGLGRYLDRHLPKLLVEDLDVAVELGLAEAPLRGLPTRLALRRGRLEVENTALLREDDNLTVALRFEDSSLDPGHGLEVATAVRLAGGAAPVRVGFDRPARVWLGRRVAAVGGLAWDGETLEITAPALSVALDPAAADGAAPVDPAVTADRLRIVPDGEATANAVAELVAGEDRAQALEDLVASLRRIEVDRPTLVFERRPEGHNFVDLLPPVRGPDAATEAGPDKPLGPLMESTRVAVERLTRGRDAARGRGFQGFVVRGFGRLERDVARVSESVGAAARAFPFQHLRVRGGQFAWRDALAAHEEGIGVAGRLENFDLDARREGGVLAFEAAFLAPGSGRSANKVDGKVQLATGDVQLHASIARLGLYAYRHVSPVSVPIQPDTTLVDTDVAMLWSPSSRVARLEGRVGVTDGAFYYRSLASEPLVGLDARLDFEAQLDTARKTAVLGKSRLELGKVRATIRGDVARYDGEPKLTGVLRLERARCQDVVDSLPVGLMPMLDGLKVEGTLAWQLDFSLDTADMDSLVYHSWPELNGFRVVDMGRRLNLDAVRGTFLHRVEAADGSPREMLVGPGSPSWVPYGQISPYMVLAVTTTEDGRFFRHSGFSPFAIRESIVTNLKKGGFVRGASTISQQLVKNLFLSREKTISRKLQEMFITWQLENALEKERIMELYLNIIEWGPGLYGIREASRHYFGKHPADLTALEAVFLASLIPNPKRYYHQYSRGEVTEGWRRHLRWILQVMVDRGKIDQATFLAAEPYSPLFRHPARHAGLEGEDDTAPVTIP